MKALKDILRVVASNITALICGILVGFFVPKMLSVEGYGYYKTFTLYKSYLGLCSLGIIDGIVLQFGAKDYNQLVRKTFRSYFGWYTLIQIIFAGVIIVASRILHFTRSQSLLLFLGAELIASNTTGFFQQISQITQRFKEYSLRKVLQSLLQIIEVLVLYFAFSRGWEISYEVYTICFIVINFLLGFWYIYTYRDIVFGPRRPLFETKGEIVALGKLGFPLLFANLCSSLIMSIDRQYVSLLFSKTDYAIYAFAYSMLSLVTVATSAIASVIYPILKRMDADTFKKNYDMFLTSVTMFVFLCVALYFPLCLFVDWYLPKYHNSLEIFRIIIPGVAISSSVTVIMHNYYKTAGINEKYFVKSMVVLAVSIAANYIAYKAVGTMASISVASVITILFWYVFADFGLKKFCSSNAVRNIIYIFIMLVLFYTASALQPVLGFAVYVLVYGLITIIFYKRNILEFSKIVKRRTQK